MGNGWSQPQFSMVDGKLHDHGWCSYFYKTLAIIIKQWLGLEKRSWDGWKGVFVMLIKLWIYIMVWPWERDGVGSILGKCNAPQLEKWSSRKSGDADPVAQCKSLSQEKGLSNAPLLKGGQQLLTSAQIYFGRVS